MLRVCREKQGRVIQLVTEGYGDGGGGVSPLLPLGEEVIIHHLKAPLQAAFRGLCHRPAV